jgi:hypothetical protein
MAMHTGVAAWHALHNIATTSPPRGYALSEQFALVMLLMARPRSPVIHSPVGGEELRKGGWRGDVNALKEIQGRPGEAVN